MGKTGGLRRRLPSHEDCSHTVCRVAMLARCQLALGRGEDKCTSVRRYIFVRCWPSQCSAVHKCGCFLFLVLAAKKVVCAWVREIYICVRMAVHVTCVTISTVNKKKNRQISSVEEHAPFFGLFWWLSESHRLSKYSVNATSIEDSLVQTHGPQNIVHPHALQVGCPFFSSAATLSSGQHGLPVMFVIATQQSHLHQCPTRDLSGPASSLAGMSSHGQASTRNLMGEHLRLHSPVGLTLRRRRILVQSGKVVSVSRHKSHWRLYTQPNLSPEDQLPSPHANGKRLHPSLRLWSLWEVVTNYVTGHCTIEDRPWCRAVSRRAGREDRRKICYWQTYSSSVWGKTSRWWIFHFCVLAPKCVSVVSPELSDSQPLGCFRRKMKHVLPMLLKEIPV